MRVFFVALPALLLLLPAAGIAQQQKRVAILPTVLHTMEPKEFLRSGIGDMLSTRLGRYEGLAVIKISDPGRATADLETARAYGREVDADWVIYGSFTSFGEGASVDLRCLRVAGGDDYDPRSVFIQSGALDEIIPLLSNMAERLASHLQAGPPVETNTEDSASQEVVRALNERVSRLEERITEIATPGDAAAGDAPAVPGAPGALAGAGALPADADVDTGADTDTNENADTEAEAEADALAEETAVPGSTPELAVPPPEAEAQDADAAASGEAGEDAETSTVAAAPAQSAAPGDSGAGEEASAGDPAPSEPEGTANAAEEAAAPAPLEPAAEQQ